MTTVNQEHEKLLQDNISGVTYSTLISNFNVNLILILHPKKLLGLPSRCSFGHISVQLSLNTFRVFHAPFGKNEVLCSHHLS